MTLTRINGSLATLSEAGGFRNHIKYGADKFGISGSIQRIPTVRAELRLFCTKKQLDVFLDDFITPLLEMKMFELDFSTITPCSCLFPPPTFQIRHSESRHVQNGMYSSNDYDGRSIASSADTEVQPIQK